jgi:myo-inositol-1(or 4)-monophosphatase
VTDQPRSRPDETRPHPGTGSDCQRLAELLAVLQQAADAIAVSLEGLSVSARRERADGHPDQYAIDVIADQAGRSVLDATGYGILSEESGWTRPGSDLVVVVDPIDGSVNAGRNLGFHGPSLCAADGAGPLAAVVHNLGTGRRYHAVRNGGAFVNGVPLAVSQPAELFAHVATGDPCPWLEGRLRRAVPGAVTRISGASAHDLCLVAESAFDAYVDCRNRQARWDYYAAGLILTETGGALVDPSGADLWDLHDPRPRQVLAAQSPGRLSDLAELMAPHRGR